MWPTNNQVKPAQPHWHFIDFLAHNELLTFFEVIQNWARFMSWLDSRLDSMEIRYSSKYCMKKKIQLYFFSLNDLTQHHSSLFTELDFDLFTFLLIKLTWICTQLLIFVWIGCLSAAWVLKIFTHSSPDARHKRQQGNLPIPIVWEAIWAPDVDSLIDFLFLVDFNYQIYKRHRKI